MARRRFTDSLPDRLTFDTSFLIDLVVESQARNQRAAEFFQRVSTANTESYYSYLVFPEFLNAVTRLFLRTERNMSEEQANDELRANGPTQVADIVKTALDKLDDLIGYTNAVLVRLDQGVWDTAKQMSLVYGLQPYDAIHAGSAIYAKCSDVVSFDSAFDRITILNRWSM